MSDKPKPCLCGSEVKLRPQIKYPNGEVSPAYIRCVDCGLTFTKGGLESDDQLIANWNQRPVEEWLRERAEKAEADAERLAAALLSVKEWDADLSYSPDYEDALYAALAAHDAGKDGGE